MASCTGRTMTVLAVMMAVLAGPAAARSSATRSAAARSTATRSADANAQQAPTLGQLALKEQERRKALKAAGKVLSPQDLPKAPPPASPATSSTPATPVVAKDPAADQKAAAKPEDQKDEAWWRQRMAQVREELRRNEMFAEALQTRVNALTNDFASRDDPYQRARVAEDRQKAMAEFDRVRTDVELQKKKMTDIEDEARRAGVPPGWLR
ncbi:MAG TPA: hypothetical protein VNJ03_09675 [Vicinamibacterales bacterium]|nr:hypothetical protein [Vicinamibacterales bacterium]